MSLAKEGPWPRPAQPRETVQVRFADGRIFEAPVGTTLEAFVRAAYRESAVPIVAALVDRCKLCELTQPVTRDMEVTPISTGDSDGMRIYRRSLTFVLVVAMHQLFPGVQVYVDHSLTFGGLYCEVQGRAPLTPQEVALLEQRMKEIVADDVPIRKRRVPLEEARALFQARGQEDKVRLLRYRRKDYVTLYRLYDVDDYFHGYMVPSTGYLRHFALQYYSPGFILRYPRHEQPTVLQPVVEYPKLVAVFREYGHWLRVLGISDVGELNDALSAGRASEVALVSEALHEQRIANIAAEIAKRRDTVRLVLIAGPSASGKTTFAKRLAIQLLANGLRPVAVELDNYFVDREKTPLDEHGQYDFEHLWAVDLELLNEQLLRLLAGQEVQLPRYNFQLGKREKGEWLKLSEEHVILLEGIHGLNPDLVPNVPRERIYRIYVSALTQLNLDHYNRVPTTETRLIRRIVRDARERGYSALDTLRRWESVRNGEKRWIFPYQEHADVMFNSALAYELSALKSLAEPLLFQIEPNAPEYVEARRLLALLHWFLPFPLELVPSNSILREFIGGSSLQHFTVWRQGTSSSGGNH
ncbi:MAG: nucleoside kinase [Chloroflexi bacterium]|nr:nucleoside kinase [Chloroflexota bacterium]